uniref:Reverse transcriptase domain-containing protein n=1 Tax=Schizaphis graminum TaxID=13262 RepID=A0A2S2NYY3_SCHGA
MAYQMKMAVKTHPGFFAKIFNSCIGQACFPADWKLARLVLLHKPGKPLDSPSAYRPLCMLDTVSKLFEKLITCRLREHLVKSGNQSENQYGFRRGRSTVDALARLQSIIKNAKGRTSATNKYVGMLTLDVKNAFNSASWESILGALVKTATPKYLRDILGQYLTNRRIVFDGTDGNSNVIEVCCGVPQGSVLGPDLWNLMYDDLLKIALPEDIELLAFADDVAIVCTAQVPFLLEERLGTALQDVVRWMSENNLELALQKTEAIVFTNKNTRNTMNVDFPPHSFPSSRCVKYLGVHLNPRLHFTQHARAAAERAMEAAKHLTRILPNLRGVKQKTRRVLATVVTSRLLYGAPIWSQYITAGAMRTMMVAYRRIMLRVACCFHTTSYEAAAIVSSMPPLDLLAIERRRIFEGMDRRAAREQLLVNWQEQWNTARSGRWTHRLIRDVAAWYRRKHGEVSYHLSQVLTGHGCFGKYQNKFCNLESDACAQCGETPDSPEHAVFKCDAWDR